MFLSLIGQRVSGDTTAQPQITGRHVFLGTAHKQRCQDQKRRGQQFDYHVQSWTGGVLERIAHCVSRHGGLRRESTEESAGKSAGEDAGKVQKRKQKQQGK